MGKQGFKDLIVWQKAKDLAVLMYKLSGEGKLGREFGAELRTQLQIAWESGLLQKAVHDEVDPDCEKLGNMIGKLIGSRSRSSHR